MVYINWLDADPGCFIIDRNLGDVRYVSGCIRLSRRYVRLRSLVSYHSIGELTRVCLVPVVHLQLRSFRLFISGRTVLVPQPNGNGIPPFH